MKTNKHRPINNPLRKKTLFYAVGIIILVISILSYSYISFENETTQKQQTDTVASTCEQQDQLLPLVDNSKQDYSTRATSSDTLQNEEALSLSHKELISLQFQYLTEELNQVVGNGASKNMIGLLLNETYLSNMYSSSSLEIHKTVNVTNDFIRLMQEAKNGQMVLPETAGTYKYLLVPGLFTSYYPGYFRKNVNYLKEKMHLDVEVVPLKDLGVEANGQKIRDYIFNSVLNTTHSEGKLSQSAPSIIIIGHSKGAIDAAAAVSMFPELKYHVKALIAIQSPFGGSAFPHDIVHNEGARKILGGLIEYVLQGHVNALEDLSYTNRHEFLRKYPFHACNGCDPNCRGISTVSLASSDSSALSLMASVIQYVKLRYSEFSDGLVTTKDAIIPGSKLIHLVDCDHAAPAFEFFPNISPYDPGEVFASLISIALDDSKHNCNELLDSSSLTLPIRTNPLL